MDARNQIYTKRYISHPLIDSTGALVATVQVEAKYHRNEYKCPQTQLKKEVRQHMGFAIIDEQVMTILATVIRIKLDQLMSRQAKHELEREVTNTINLAGAICTQRSQADLVKHLKFSLPEYFGFEGASILLRDVKTDLIFTINEITKENRVEIKKREQKSPVK